MSVSDPIIEQRPLLVDPAHPALSALDPVLARIYAARGIDDPVQLGRRLQELLPDSQMLGIEAAVARLLVAFEQQQSILIVGDFDCDGATSTAVAMLGLRMLGAGTVDYLVPNRFEYGYGLSPEIVDVAATASPDLLITVDNGISSIDGVERANARGIDVIVTDHHLAGDALPAACAIVNPNQPGCDFIAKSTCGVGVIFYVLIALRRALQARGWFKAQPPNLANLLDLVALGTVADVVPLERNNRALVWQGMQRIRAGQARPGLLALIEVAGRRREQLVASDLGFAIAPRLNAAGRLEDMSIGIECLLEDDYERALEMARSLDDLNKERRGIEQEMQQQALELLGQLSLNDRELPFGLCLYDEAWHQGVIGILASRIKERVHRPVIAFAPGDAGEIKGSARSISGFHIRDGLDAVAAKHPGLLKKFGGHAMAAGLTLAADQLDRFRDAFDAEVRRQLQPEQLQWRVQTDGELPEHALNMALAEELRNAGPWGHQFPEPLFEGRFHLLQQRIVGQRHLKLVVMPEGGTLALDAIAFNVDTLVWPDESVQRVRLVYRLDINEFRGQRTLQLMVDWIGVD
ncbi:MAG: single-stranded-DNA-specific exonuclease RecJ [Oceanospirillales bacterium]|uniref:Single-stranded-DNA-specific exonuclease RecJ n=1 Tax=Marinobacterium halophilum TaxID=267374 RepID=A0A2P8ET88_9GAMM|nr:single-stranded-DNA-specific exonuclease RecJ [Marinobacterium halophilum]MBR9827820.1 single-stranded-DNA-specific exonuclease RecJ [Oceanospirillales bacterium]PSL12697.1 exonuclease RecJ [Marinobacterium halophilum]